MTTTETTGNLSGVFAVPALARKADAQRNLDFDQNDLIVRHIRHGGIKRLIYGGNAFLYHLTLREYEQLLTWLNDVARDSWVIPSAGPSYGRAMDQANLLRGYSFPGVMMLPSGDPRDTSGLERGYREFADAAQTQLIVYLKEETTLGSDKVAGLDMVARLINDGVCIGIKYAVVRPDPRQDSYLQALLERVDRNSVISGIGERPALIHLRDWKLPGFTTGSGCIAPRSSQQIFSACAGEDFATAEKLRATFIPLEDKRDEWGPARVLHAATELAGIASLGEVPPYLTGLSEEQIDELTPIARKLMEFDQSQLVAGQS
ncbi:MAG: dihydrodipicolinate synthase family protein [Pyrinomonadaceae bacterium]|nr:dihydrodipicolinate synthase family protein [Pyrinomonadaceae bacterium]